MTDDTKHESTLVYPKCPTCGETAILDKGVTTTLMGSMPFVGKDKKVHDHNPNRIQGTFVCPNQHEFQATTGYQCSCGWKSDYVEDAE